MNKYSFWEDAIALVLMALAGLLSYITLAVYF
jgi:hypothetical protein